MVVCRLFLSLNAFPQSTNKREPVPIDCSCLHFLFEGCYLEIMDLFLYSVESFDIQLVMNTPNGLEPSSLYVCQKHLIDCSMEVSVCSKLLAY